MGQKQKKEKIERATALGRIITRAERKVESNNSPEIPDKEKGDIRSAPASLRVNAGGVSTHLLTMLRFGEDGHRSDDGTVGRLGPGLEPHRTRRRHSHVQLFQTRRMLHTMNN